MRLRRLYIVILFILGISLVSTAWVGYYFNIGIDKLFVAFLAISGVVIALGEKINGWLEALFGKEEEPSKKIEVVIRDYSKTNNVAKDNLKKMIDEYLDWVQESFGTIVLRGIERGGEQAVNLPLEEVYIPLRADILNDASEQSRGKGFVDFSIEGKVGNPKYQKIIRLNEIFSFRKGVKRVVITGGPGSGKTTVLLHFAWTLAKALRYNSQLARQKLGMSSPIPIPIYIPITRYAQYLRKLSPSATAEQSSLKAFIPEYLNERSTNLGGLGKDFLSYLLGDGKEVLLLLDGMDEVPTENERVLIISKIKDLISGRNNLRLVVTSRTAAYQGRAVFGSDFRHVQVLPLESKQVRKLIQSAYRSIFPNSEIKALQSAEDLLYKIEQLEGKSYKKLDPMDDEKFDELNIRGKSLADSPIMVRMLLIVHYNERKLPDQRADLYQKSIDVILRPDNAPDPNVTSEIEKRIAGSLALNREMLQHLAFHMHMQGIDRGREIDEIRLRQILESEPAYEPYVDNLITQTRERGTLLEERGGLYRFLHFSFQEFLAGRYLAQNFIDTDKLIAFLEDGLISDLWWREPILLMIGYLDLSAPIQARRLLFGLGGLDGQKNSRTKNLNTQLISCSLASMGFLECQSQANDVSEMLKDRLKLLFIEVQSNRPTPSLLASSMDSLDRLGYLPDDLYQFIRIDCAHPFFISKYPVTNVQYKRFLLDKDWIKDKKIHFPRYWTDPQFGVLRRAVPVVGIFEREISVYCDWLLYNWDQLEESKQGIAKPKTIRLPLEEEWIIAAGGKIPNYRYPWDLATSNAFKEVDFNDYANVYLGGINHTTLVWMYPKGISPQGVMDMAGNVWELQIDSKIYDSSQKKPQLVARGSSWTNSASLTMVSERIDNTAANLQGSNNTGFRIVLTF